MVLMALLRPLSSLPGSEAIRSSRPLLICSRPCLLESSASLALCAPEEALASAVEAVSISAAISAVTHLSWPTAVVI